MNANRWWENYLVRYLMPSIAGVVIVLWLSSFAGAEFKRLIYLDIDKKGLETPELILLFLYGNLFCYISSYPILGFHVTRMIDFKNRKWQHKVFLDGYLVTIILGITAVLSCFLFPGNKSSSFIIVILFSLIQIVRFYCATIDNAEKGGEFYLFAYNLAKRRGVIETVRKKQTSDLNEKHTKNVWRREFIETYRHMREHGNSAFIFILEMILATLCYCILMAYNNEPADYKLSLLGVILIIWAAPAMFVHLLGQYLERCFSEHDEDTNEQKGKEAGRSGKEEGKEEGRC